MRRRLWWHIYILDVRTAEDTGSEPSILESSFDTLLPLNIDDGSLHHDMGEPVGRVGKTEMLFTLARFKVSSFARQVVFSDQFCRDNGYMVLSPGQKCNSIDEFRQQMEDGYLRHCDKKIPFDFITVAATRLILVKLKLTVTKQRTSQNSLSQGNFQKVCVEVLQHARKLRLYEKGQRWLWLFQTYVEWDALGYLLIDLCAFQNEAAWSVADEVYQYWKNHDIRDQRWGQIEELYSQADGFRGLRLDNSAGVSPSSHDNFDPSESMGEAPASGTACEWSVGMFERYFQVLDTQTTWL
ncbi:hypothetical protein MW887_006681 [Aspergillus wentii]|nr:hypothetical protein MW887_006681 [Aspergillus wentii]